jgi:hypothetical protein
MNTVLLCSSCTRFQVDLTFATAITDTSSPLQFLPPCLLVMQ